MSRVTIVEVELSTELTVDWIAPNNAANNKPRSPTGTSDWISKTYPLSASGFTWSQGPSKISGCSAKRTIPGKTVILPMITVLPGMVLFALHPEILLGPWDQVKPEADKGYVLLIQSLVPVGLRGLLLAALFGAIQSTVNSVLNSTSTIVTLDIYKRMFRPDASDKDLVRVGVISSVVILAFSIVLGGFVGKLGGSLFEYIQSLYAFFAPPFAAVFVLGILWKRINGTGALTTVILGFALGIAIKLYLSFATAPPPWLVPYANQASINWFFCLTVCTGVSLLTSPPRAEQ